MLEPAVERALAELLRGLGRRAPDADRFVAWRWGDPPFAEDVFTDPAIARRATRLYVSRMALHRPRETLSFVKSWHASLLAAAEQPGLSRDLLVCGAAYKWAGEFEESVSCLRQAVAVAETEAGRRSAAISLASSLSWAGEHDEAVQVAEDAAKEVIAAYDDDRSPALLEAEQVLASCRLEAGQVDLDLWVDLRERRWRATGLAAPDTAVAFYGVGRCWLETGHLQAALACAATAVAIRDQCVLSAFDSARIDWLLAGAAEHAEELPDKDERAYWQARGREAARHASFLLLDACGPDHRLVRGRH